MNAGRLIAATWFCLENIQFYIFILHFLFTLDNIYRMTTVLLHFNILETAFNLKSILHISLSLSFVSFHSLVNFFVIGNGSSLVLLCCNGTTNASLNDFHTHTHTQWVFIIWHTRAHILHFYISVYSMISKGRLMILFDQSVSQFQRLNRLTIRKEFEYLHTHTCVLLV